MLPLINTYLHTYFLMISDISFSSGPRKSCVQYVSRRCDASNVCEHKIHLQISCRILTPTGASHHIYIIIYQGPTNWVLHNELKHEQIYIQNLAQNSAVSSHLCGFLFIVIGAIHKRRHQLRGKMFSKRWSYLMSLFIKLMTKGGGGSKMSKKCWRLLWLWTAPHFGFIHKP